jgi:hypothetical protein
MGKAVIAEGERDREGGLNPNWEWSVRMQCHVFRSRRTQLSPLSMANWRASSMMVGSAVLDLDSQLNLTMTMPSHPSPLFTSVPTQL